MTADAPVTLSVVVTAHAEGRLLRPTLRSVAAAITEVTATGARVELVLACDTADEPTLREARRWVERDDLDFEVVMLQLALGESGASRNAGVAAARGTYVGLVDGDDLVSANYFRAATRVLQERDDDVVVHPEYVISFGARSVIWRTDPTDHRDVSYRDLVRHNLWPSSSTSTRRLLLEHPYRSLHPGSGYGPEDWVWNIDTTAAGVTHLVADGTVFFYRVREAGGVNNRHALSMLPAFDLAALRAALPPVTGDAVDGSQPRPRGLRPLAHRTYAAALPLARRSTAWLSFPARRAIYRSVRWVFRLGGGGAEDAPPPTVPDSVAVALRDAVEIDPAISWTAHQVLSLPVWRARDDGYAEYLEEALDGIGDRGRVLVLVPWLGVGGADLVSLNYARALNEIPEFAGRVTILATFLPERTRRDYIPDSLHFVQLDERWLDLDSGQRRRFLAQLLVQARAQLVVSVNCFHFTEALASYATQILGTSRAFVSLFAWDRIPPGYPVNPITDDSQRLWLDRIGGVITDNTVTAAHIDDILALPPGQVLVHRQPALDDVPTLRTDTAAFHDEVFSDTHPFRLVWPHRLDGEKRPDVLVALAAELSRRGVPAVIDVWGQRVLTKDGDTLLHDLEHAGVHYRGPYSGGLAALPLGDYHALLLTSQTEGLPLVLVQSLLLGLPVISSAVGGVTDVILADETGVLAAGPDDIGGFADAVVALMDDVELRRRLIRGGHRFAAEKHSWDAFRHSVASAFAPA